MNTRLFYCSVADYGHVPLRPFNADHETCMAFACGCSSKIFTKDIEDWCHNAKPGDYRVFGETVIVALHGRPR